VGHLEAALYQWFLGAPDFPIAATTVINARPGWWQDRKRAWIALGIKPPLAARPTFKSQKSLNSLMG
jgi:hypothetical protein